VLVFVRVGLKKKKKKKKVINTRRNKRKKYIFQLTNSMQGFHLTSLPKLGLAKEEAESIKDCYNTQYQSP
jgi:hypothetical protein